MRMTPKTPGYQMPRGATAGSTVKQKPKRPKKAIRGKVGKSGTRERQLNSGGVAMLVGDTEEKNSGGNPSVKGGWGGVLGMILQGVEIFESKRKKDRLGKTGKEWNFKIGVRRACQPWKRGNPQHGGVVKNKVGKQK